MASAKKYSAPVLLTKEHDLSYFSCQHESLTHWLTQRALSNHMTGGTRTWVVLDDQERVIAYYASATASILHTQATSRARRSQPEPIPAIMLSRLAVDIDHQGRGLGGGLLKHFLFKALDVANLVGVRVAIVHAIDQQAREFYEHFNFVPSPIEQNLLLLILSDIAFALSY